VKIPPCLRSVAGPRQLYKDFAKVLKLGEPNPFVKDGDVSSPIMAKSFTWTALKNPAFRKLWLATVISGTSVATRDSATTWSTNLLTASPLLISPMSTVASLPFILFILLSLASL
jgi:hypothetical protein